MDTNEDKFFMTGLHRDITACVDGSIPFRKVLNWSYLFCGVHHSRENLFFIHYRDLSTNNCGSYKFILNHFSSKRPKNCLIIQIIVILNDAHDLNEQFFLLW